MSAYDLFLFQVSIEVSITQKIYQKTKILKFEVTKIRQKIIFFGRI